MKLLTDYLKPGTIFFRNHEFAGDAISSGINVVARYLSDNLTSPSPFVYLYASNHPKTVLAFFGIIKVRRICVVVDPEIGPLELNEMMLDTPPAACIRLDERTIEWDFAAEIDVRPSVELNGIRDDLHDVCMLMYTAADDGIAKAAMLTCENVYSNAVAIAEGNLVDPQSVSMAILPFSHGFGLQAGVLTPNFCGGRSVIIENRELSNGTLIFQALSLFGVTHIYSVPAVYYLLGKQFRSPVEIKCVRSYISGGYALSEFIRDRFLDSYGICIRQGYGLTEASPVCSWVFQNAPVRTNSIGKPIGCCEMKIDTVETPVTGMPVTGEIAVRGSNVMKGYYNRPGATKRVLRNGWLLTGDIGHQDDAGYFYLDRTKKRMINYGGAKVYPGEVERLLCMNPNVLSANVYGIADRLQCERVGARLHLRENTEDSRIQVQKWMRENLSLYKIPKVLQFNSELN